MSKKKVVAKTNKPVKNKAEELKARSAADQIQKNTVLGVYDKKLAKVKKARDHCATDYFQTGFRARKSAVEGAWLRLKEASEQNSFELETAEQLKPLRTALKDADAAIKRLDEFTHDARRDVAELETYVLTYDDAPLFEKEMKETAIWNKKKGVPEVKKRN